MSTCFPFSHDSQQQKEEKIEKGKNAEKKPN
jgi:hypothetical protein